MSNMTCCVHCRTNINREPHGILKKSRDLFDLSATRIAAEIRRRTLDYGQGWRKAAII
jgi:hypothetical protein